MRVTQAIHRDGALYVEVDGRKLHAFQSKYTILELGYALYLFVGDPDEEWLKENGETIPADPSDSRSALESNGWLITSDPILFTLAYEHWWAQNGRPKPENVPLPIPLLDEALEIMRTREIINDWNQKYAGVVPPNRALGKPSNSKRRSKKKVSDPVLERQLAEITRKFDRHDYIEPCVATEVNGALPLAASTMLMPRMERAVMNQILEGEAMVTRYAIWAETLRGMLLSVHDDCRNSRCTEQTAASVVKAINSLGAFSEIQRALDPFRNS